MPKSSWWPFGERKTVANETPPRSEIQDHEWASLESLWRRVVPPAETDRFADLLKDPPAYRAAGWNAFNFAELQVGARLDDTQVAVEYRALLRIANQRNLPGVADFNIAAATVTDETAQPLTKKVATYLSLLYALQSDFINSRFERQLRREVAERLFSIGWICVALTLLAPIGVLIACLVDEAAPAGCCSALTDNAFVLTLAATFGVLGSFFSLTNDFQTKIRTLNFEDVDALYKRRMILLRLLFGLIGALIFYCVIRSGLLSGTVFPKLETLKLGDLFAKVAPTARSSETDPAINLAKLLVWSFIAGFSERLVPQTLSATEARAAQPTETKPAPPPAKAPVTPPATDPKEGKK